MPVEHMLEMIKHCVQVRRTFSCMHPVLTLLVNVCCQRLLRLRHCYHQALHHRFVPSHIPELRPSKVHVRDWGVYHRALDKRNLRNCFSMSTDQRSMGLHDRGEMLLIRQLPVRKCRGQYRHGPDSVLGPNPLLLEAQSSCQAEDDCQLLVPRWTIVCVPSREILKS